MSAGKTFLTIILFLFLMLITGSIFTIHEGQKGLKLRLGELVTDANDKPVILQPGINFKWPVLNQARVFDTRIQTLAIESSRVVTARKKDVVVDYYAKWRITDLPLYFIRTSGNQNQVKLLLQQQLNNILRAEFGKRDIPEVVSGERVDIMKLLREKADDTAKSLGIEIIDARVKRIDLPVEVSKAVFDRMSAERKQIANEHRQRGRAVAEKIRAEADQKAAIIVADAKSKAKNIHGQGEAIAAKTYADAFNQDPDFFAFYRSMSSYEEVFSNNNDVLVLKPDGEFFKYFLPADHKS